MYYSLLYMPYSWLLIPSILISLFAQWYVKSTFSKYSKVMVRRNMTGNEAATAILKRSGIYNVTIERINGKMTDHYDPKAKVLRLSETVYDKSSIAALGVAAHEAGHAIQHSSEYMPIKLRNSIVPVVGITSKMAFPLFLLGMFTSSDILMTIGIFGYTIAVLFYLITLPIEFNASTRAIAVLSKGYLYDEEISGAKKVLAAAAFTYVASALVALLQLVRLLGIMRRR